MARYVAKNPPGSHPLLSLTISGSATFKYELECEDTCTGETWSSALSAGVSGEVSGSAQLPGLCSFVAKASTAPTRLPSKIKRRYEITAKIFCSAAVAKWTKDQIDQVQAALESEVFAQIQAQAAAMGEGGATEMCKIIRSNR